MIDLYGVLQEQEIIKGDIGLGVEYYKGETGAQGIPGKDGKDGKTPIKGVDYYTDEEIASIKEEIAKEVTVGAKGEDGKSAYQIALDEGFEGSETDWLASLKGKDGKDGINGTDGKPGKDGTNGVDGKTPVKGVDYFTQAEIQQVENNAAAKVDLSDYAKSADLSTVATSGSYEDLTNKPTIPAAYELPIASTTTLGGVKVGSGLSITNGVLSANSGGVADSVDWSKVQNKPNFADVATSGNYNDLSNKPTIPSVKGLASEAYVNEKVAAIVIPEVPTKVSELENDKGYLTEHQSLEGYAKTADLAQVAKTGSYNDLADKPTIPSTTGLASTKYVDDKVGGIVIPEVPTKISAFENDSKYVTERYLITNYLDVNQVEVNEEGNVYLIIGKDIAATYDTENNEITTTYAKKTEIPEPYTLPIASTSTLGGVKVDGSTITIADGVISAKGGSGGSEPDAYIKDASVSGNTLTLTKKDDTEVVFTSSMNKQAFHYQTNVVLTDEQKAQIQKIKENPNDYDMFINDIKIIRITKEGTPVYYFGFDSSGDALELNAFIVEYDMRFAIRASGDIITSSNWQNYITVGSDWQYTNDLQDPNLYNAKELVVYAENTQGNKQMGYFNFGDSNLGNHSNENFYFDYDTSSPYIIYNGFSLTLTNINIISYLCYKT